MGGRSEDPDERQRDGAYECGTPKVLLVTLLVPHSCSRRASPPSAAVALIVSLPALKQSLSKERSMADFIGSQIVPTTNRFMDLTRSGTTVGV